MAKAPDLDDITNILNSASTINNNNQLIETAFQNTLSRDGSTPNQMEANLDMNSFDILNAGTINFDNFQIDDDNFRDLLDEAIAAAAASEASATASAASAASSEQALDDFTDMYLGTAASDPATDPDGDPLEEGALYFNTSDLSLKIYSGGVWRTGVANTSDFLQSANNLSDVPNASTARTNLGVAIGTDVQAQDTTLQSFADNAPFALKNITYLTGGAGTYNTPSGVRAIKVTCVGAGGQGGNYDGQGAGTSGVAGPGNGGAWCQAFITSPDASFSYVAGLSLTSNVIGGNGGNGQASTFSNGGSINLSAGGGLGGLGIQGAASGSANQQPQARATASGGTINISGNQGTAGRCISNLIYSFPEGADTNWGSGGRLTDGSLVNTGEAATGFGSGGAGAYGGNTADNFVGGDGAPGLIIVEEYY